MWFLKADKLNLTGFGGEGELLCHYHFTDGHVCLFIFFFIIKRYELAVIKNLQSGF